METAWKALQNDVSIVSRSWFFKISIFGALISFPWDNFALYFNFVTVQCLILLLQPQVLQLCNFTPRRSLMRWICSRREASANSSFFPSYPSSTSFLPFTVEMLITECNFVRKLFFIPFFTGNRWNPSSWMCIPLIFPPAVSKAVSRLIPHLQNFRL